MVPIYDFWLSGQWPAPVNPVQPPVQQPGYHFVTLQKARQTLANRLQDPNNIYWSAAELNLYIQEALRTWQAYTGWYRDRATFTAKANQLFYDLPSVLVSESQVDPSPTGAFGYNVTDQYVTASLLYHLLEDQLSGGSWAGTDQFNLDEVQNALQNRINRFLGDSGCVVSLLEQQIDLALPRGRFRLPSSVIDVRRVTWIEGDQVGGLRTLLWRADEWAINSFLSGWQTPGEPKAYSVAVTPPASLQIAPYPDSLGVTGLLELLLIQNGPVISLATNTTPLNVPDDFTWGVKWGALADLLSQDGQARDTVRAQYCEQRYQECVQLARAFPSVMQVQVNGVSIWSGSIFDLDAYQSGWDNLPPGAPQFAGLAGRNLLALSPVVSTDTPISVDLVRNIPVPAVDTDFLQVPGDLVDVILDYAQHLASFKMAGEEFLATDTLRLNLLYAAAEYNGRLRQLAFFNDALRGPGLKQTAEVTRIDSPDLTAYSGVYPT